MYCNLKSLICIIFTLCLVDCQIYVVYYYRSNFGKRTFFCYKKVNYANKNDMMEAIMKDYASIPFCCLYMLEAMYNGYTNSYLKLPSSRLEQVVETKSLRRQSISCNTKKYCPLTKKIKIYTKHGRTVYECGGEIFNSLYSARLYLLQRRGRRVRFNSERRLYFNEEQSPVAVKEAKENRQWSSRSIS